MHPVKPVPSSEDMDYGLYIAVQKVKPLKKQELLCQGRPHSF